MRATVPRRRLANAVREGSTAPLTFSRRGGRIADSLYNFTSAEHCIIRVRVGPGSPPVEHAWSVVRFSTRTVPGASPRR